MAKTPTLIGLLLGSLLWAWGPPLPALGAGAAVLPLVGPAVRAFDPPGQPWLAGHRGVDLLGTEGTAVAAAMAGRVAFAGSVAGRGVVVVLHGELRTTYLPVQPLVEVGAVVSAGTVIGLLRSGHGCPGGLCLHWGLKRGEQYLDPLSLLGPAPVRLLPAAAVSQVRALYDYRDAALRGLGPVGGVLARPVPGAVSSPFGLRLHPILRIRRPHNGVDLDADCGDPIRAAAPGRVVRVSYDAESGHRLELDHGVVGGHRLTTLYLHATGWSVTAGAQVAGGQMVGQVGSTGLSTGCHLHFAVKVDGSYVDPERFW